MPYAPHTLVTIGGSLLETAGQPQEIWQTGCRVDSVNDLQAYLDALAGNDDDNPGTIRQWWGVAGNGLSSAATLEWVRVAAVFPDHQDPALVHNYPSAIPGPNGPQFPNFVCVALTLETATPKAHGGRGRIYPPNTVRWTGSSIAPADATAMAMSGVSFIDALSGGGTTGAVPCVASRKYGTLLPVVAVSADCILDTQRRRRNNLIEFRQTQPV